MKPNINSVEVHPQLSNNGHPNGWCTGGCWLTMATEKVFSVHISSGHPAWTPGGSWLTLAFLGAGLT